MADDMVGLGGATGARGEPLGIGIGADVAGDASYTNSPGVAVTFVLSGW